MFRHLKCIDQVKKNEDVVPPHVPTIVAAGLRIMHLESLYVTPHRNSPHRVTDVVTIFGRILYVFAENSVRFCTVVGAASAPPRYRILYKSTVIWRIRATASVPYMHRNSAHIF
jgi:hypothetical protein